MARRYFSLILGLVLGAVWLACPTFVHGQTNVILMVIDDMGVTDWSGGGNDFYETPHLDRLAREGAHFTHAYSACTVCSPSRAALLTGRHPARLHVTDWIPGHARPNAPLTVPDWPKQLDLNEKTLAEWLRPLGYATASVGKWHLGGPGFGPEDQGFEVNKAGTNQGQPRSFFSPYQNPKLPDGPPGEYLTDREAAEAEAFISANATRPFFLYVPHHAVHTPIQAKKELIEKYRNKKPGTQHRHAAYAAMLESMDHSIGRILATLEKHGLADKTMFIFTSDNGGHGPVTSNHPFREGKGTVYEGGVRVPLIFWGKGIPARKIDFPTQGINVLPTILEFLNIPIPAGLDGHSIAATWRADPLPEQPLFWHYPHYHVSGATPYGALRDRSWKLIEYFEDGFLELYDLKNDPGEQKNLANQMPWKAVELQQKLAQWRTQVKAQMPSRNSAHAPSQETNFLSHVLRPDATGAIVLPAQKVRIHGTNLRYEPQTHKNTVGYWSKPDEWISWDFVITDPGTYEIHILQGCGPRNGGSPVDVLVGGKTISFVVQETKGFQDFIPRTIGEVSFNEQGRQTISFKPVKKTADAVMDLREVRLVRKQG